MAQFFIQLPAGDTLTLDLDLDTTTVAAVKATIDARLESTWRASGVRILRSDLPFCGITLSHQNRLLAMDQVLSGCGVEKDSRLYAQWPQKSEKDERRKRYGKGLGNESVVKRRRGERGAKKPEDEEKSTESHGGSEKRPSSVVEDDTHSALEIGGDEQNSSGCVSEDRPGDENVVEAEGDSPDAGGQAASEGQDEQQADEEGQEERTTGEVEQDDPFADEDDDKENREPLPGTFAPVMDDRRDDHLAEERFDFDESNSGLGTDLLEVFEF